jgi:release factor glutamine methyltransferase
MRGEPLPYIFGKAYFYDREFFVDGNVLIPRPDTETLVEAVINSEKNCPARFVDIGTGSGIIAAILTAHRPAWSAVAVDISSKALLIAKKNLPSSNTAASRGQSPVHAEQSQSPPPQKNITLVCCDMLTALKPKSQFDFIVSNPPYISSTQMKTLDNSVINYEPHAALDGGGDGLDYYRRISSCAKMYLNGGGRVYLEIGYDQGGSVPEILRDGGWSGVTVIKDLGGRDRVVTAVKSF